MDERKHVYEFEFEFTVPDDADVKLDALKETLDEIGAYECVADAPKELMDKATEQYKPFTQVPMTWLWVQIIERRKAK